MPVKLTRWTRCCKCSDVLTIHVPDTPLTQNMIDADAIAKMKSGAFLLNNARGSIVDLGALAVALRTGHLGGAAIDVFPEEPSENDSSFGHELCGIENVILTPHIGGSTREAQENIARDVAEKMAKFLTTGSTIGAVNLPEVALRERPDQLRILHIHHNVPGVLSRLHATIAQVGLNINAEALDSNAHRSCVLLDVDPTDDPAVFQPLGGMPETIRLHTFLPQISRTFLRHPSLTADETRGEVDQHQSDIHAASSFIADFTGHSQRSATRALHPLRAPDRIDPRL